MAYNGDDFDDDERQQNVSASTVTSPNVTTSVGEVDDLGYPGIRPEERGEPLTGSAFPSNKDSGASYGDETDEAGDETIGWFRPICIAIVAISIIWVMRLFLPLVQVFFASELFCVQWWIYLFMVLIPLGAICYAAWTIWRTFIALPKGVHCRYSDYIGKEGELRKLLTRKYLTGFYNLRRNLDNEIAVHLQRLCLGKRDADWLDDNKWIEEYGKFQELLKKKAEEIKNTTAKRMGVFTVISRESRLDIIGVLFFSSLMVLKIARVFNKRMTTVGAMKTTVFWAMNLYLGGKFQNLGGKIARDVAEVASEVAEKVSGSPIVGTLVKQTASAVVGSAVEYTANRVLAAKLGDMAIKEFVAVKGL